MLHQNQGFSSPVSQPHHARRSGCVAMTVVNFRNQPSPVLNIDSRQRPTTMVAVVLQTRGRQDEIEANVYVLSAAKFHGGSTDRDKLNIHCSRPALLPYDGPFRPF